MVDAQDINGEGTHMQVMTQAALLAVMKSCAELECRMTQLEACVWQVDEALDMIKTCQAHQWCEQQAKNNQTQDKNHGENEKNLNNILINVEEINGNPDKRSGEAGRGNKGAK